MRADLAEEGVDRRRLDAIKAPAGFDIGAITSEEIALSIMAEMVEVRRQGQRATASEAAQSTAIDGEKQWNSSAHKI